MNENYNGNTNYGAPTPPTYAYQQPVYQQPAYQPGYTAVSPKNKLTALFLCIFLGGLGIHLFYLGITGKAVMKLVLFIVSVLLILPCGIPYIGWFLFLPACCFISAFLLTLSIIDIVKIAKGNMLDAQGLPVKK